MNGLSSLISRAGLLVLVCFLIGIGSNLIPATTTFHGGRSSNGNYNFKP